MKKLNRKGFTLIELLAVIVILAVVMVVTIPSVLNAMKTARQKQFDNAIATIKDYVQKNYDLCSLGSELGTSDYDSSLITTSCTLQSTANILVTAPGYSTNDISTVEGNIPTSGTNEGEFQITKACPNATGKFKDATGIGDCS